MSEADARGSVLPEPPWPTISVRELLGAGPAAGDLALVHDDADLERLIAHPRIQKSGLALVGHATGVEARRIQILGETELSYLESITAEERARGCRAFLSLGLSCVLVTRGVDPPAELVDAARETRTPLLLSGTRSSATITAVHDFLDDRLAPTMTVHGGLVDVFGLGVLLLGKSGVGKSECALDLVARGHRLVADDVVRLQLRPRREVIGTPAELLRYHIEVRGLGILDVRELFGVVAVSESKRVDLVVELVEWRDGAVYERLGLEEPQYPVLGVLRPHSILPVRPGRNMAVIVEIAARNELLKRRGYHAAERFRDRLEQALVKQPNGT